MIQCDVLKIVISFLSTSWESRKKVGGLIRRLGQNLHSCKGCVQINMVMGEWRDSGAERISQAL